MCLNKASFAQTKPKKEQQQYNLLLRMQTLNPAIEERSAAIGRNEAQVWLLDVCGAIAYNVYFSHALCLTLIGKGPGWVGGSVGGWVATNQPSVVSSLLYSMFCQLGVMWGGGGCTSACHKSVGLISRLSAEDHKHAEHFAPENP